MIFKRCFIIELHLLLGHYLTGRFGPLLKWFSLLLAWPSVEEKIVTLLVYQVSTKLLLTYLWYLEMLSLVPNLIQAWMIFSGI